MAEKTPDAEPDLRNITYAPGRELSGAIADRMIEGRGRGVTGRVMAQRYLEICQKSRPYLAPGEVEYLVGLDVDTSDPELWRLLVRDRVVSEIKTPSIMKGLLHKLDTWSVVERFAVVDSIERSKVTGVYFGGRPIEVNR